MFDYVDRGEILSITVLLAIVSGLILIGLSDLRCAVSPGDAVGLRAVRQGMSRSRRSGAVRARMATGVQRLARGRQHMAESEQFDDGPEIRREVLGADYVDANLADTDEFMTGFQRLLTEWAWGYAWSRPGLDRKTRSMLNLAILTALGRPQELGIYVKGAALDGGLSRGDPGGAAPRDRRPWHPSGSPSVPRRGRSAQSRGRARGNAVDGPIDG